MGSLKDFFAPDRVAVIGATDRDGSVGRAILTNLHQSFSGTVVPVNPNRDEVFEDRCYPNISQAPSVDLAVVVLPPKAAIVAVRQVGEAGIENVIVISSGFSEIGGAGERREGCLIDIADRYDLNLVGPNSLGLMSTNPDINATFGPASARPGSISFVSQSGAFITAVIDWASDHGIGFKHVISLGNEAVLDQTDFIRAWGDDADTDVILGYFEAIDAGRTFIDVCRSVTGHTPIIALKSGRTEAGAHAASSHTGSIAGSDRAYTAGFEQAGVIRVDTVQEFFDFASLLSTQPIPDGDAVAIVTNAGGPGVMTADVVGDTILSMTRFSDNSISKLESVLPPQSSTINPVDVLGDADDERFADVIEIALTDPGVSAVIVVAAPTAVLSYPALAERLIDLRQAHEVPMTSVLMGGTRIEASVEALREHGIPNYVDPSRAVKSLEALFRYRDISMRTYVPPPVFDVDESSARHLLKTRRDRGRTQLGVDAMDLLDSYGIPTAAGAVVESPHDAKTVARRIDGPVAMKIVSPDIQHKTDIGGVKVDVNTHEVADGYEELVTRTQTYQPSATIDGVYVQEMIDLERSTETIVGCTRDPQFGPVMLFGLGGIFVETMEDTAVRIGPLSEPEARSMVTEIRSASLLRGARGRPPADLDAIVDALLRISQLVSDFPAILELDVNPLVAGPDGVMAIDLRLTIDNNTI